MKNNDWLNNFVEKNSWGIIIAIIGITLTYGLLRGQVLAQDERIHTIEQAQIVIVENQKSIIQLQTNQTNITEDIREIKEDIKRLVGR